MARDTSRTGPRTGRAGLTRRDLIKRESRGRERALDYIFRSPVTAWTVVIWTGFVLVCSVLAIWARQQPLVAVGRIMNETALVRVPFPIEVNPRFSASMELVERAAGVSLFALHRDGSAGRLGSPPGRPREVVGKAVVFARHDVRVGDPRRWGVELADVPHPGELIAGGRPICTVFARGRDGDACTAALVEAARRVYRGIARAARGAA